MNDQAVACLMFGIYGKNASGIIDRQECSVCNGDRCPYTVEEVQHRACPHCFGTGMAPAAVFELQNQIESVVSALRRDGTDLARIASPLMGSSIGARRFV